MQLWFVDRDKWEWWKKVGTPACFILLSVSSSWRKCRNFFAYRKIYFFVSQRFTMPSFLFSRSNLSLTLVFSPINVFIILDASLRACLHEIRSELKPVWNLTPLWNVVPFTWQFVWSFHCGNFLSTGSNAHVQMISFNYCKLN